MIQCNLIRCKRFVQSHGEVAETKETYVYDEAQRLIHMLVDELMQHGLTLFEVLLMPGPGIKEKNYR